MGHFYLFLRLDEEVILILFQLHIHNFFSDNADWKSKSRAKYQCWKMAFIICWKQRIRRGTKCARNFR